MKNILVRILAFVLVLTMVFAFAACTKEEPAKDDDKEQTGDNTGDNTGDEGTGDEGTGDEGGNEEEDLCPDCGEPLDECTCETEAYTPFSVPSASVVYGEALDTLSFNDVSGMWEVVTEEGEDQGAVYATTPQAIAIVNNIDFKNASKITISADIKAPTGSQTDCGFVLDYWLSADADSIFQWEGEYTSYMFMYMNGANTIMSKLGPVAIGDDAGWGAFESWWQTAASYNVVYTDYAPVMEFQADEYINLKVEYDCANEVYTIFYNGEAVESADFDARIFDNDGANQVGIRTNGANIYYKNINVVVE